MTWTARSVVGFGVAVFAVTLAGEGLYHLIGTPGCESTPARPVRCSEESGWWALVLGGSAIGALVALRALRQGIVRRLTFGLLLLGLGLAPVWAAVDDRTDAGGWIGAGAVTGILGIMVLAGVAAAGLRAVRQPDPLAGVAESAGPAALSLPPSPAAPPRRRTPDPDPPPAPAPSAEVSAPSEPPAAPASGGPTVAPTGDEDPFGREPGEGGDPFGREE